MFKKIERMMELKANTGSLVEYISNTGTKLSGYLKAVNDNGYLDIEARDGGTVIVSMDNVELA